MGTPREGQGQRSGGAGEARGFFTAAKHEGLLRVPGRLIGQPAQPPAKGAAALDDRGAGGARSPARRWARPVGNGDGGGSVWAGLVAGHKTFDSPSPAAKVGPQWVACVLLGGWFLICQERYIYSPANQTYV